MRPEGRMPSLRLPKSWPGTQKAAPETGGVSWKPDLETCHGSALGAPGILGRGSTSRAVGKQGGVGAALPRRRLNAGAASWGRGREAHFPANHPAHLSRAPLGASEARRLPAPTSMLLLGGCSRLGSLR